MPSVVIVLLALGAGAVGYRSLLDIATRQWIAVLLDGFVLIVLALAVWYVRKIHRQTNAKQEPSVEALPRAAQLNGTGEVALNIMHDINQSLTAIVNYAQGSIRRLRNGESDPVRLIDVLEQIVAQAQRAADSIRALRSVVTQHPSSRVYTDINKIVKQAAELSHADMRGRGITVTLDLSASLPRVCVDDIQTEQVVLHLLQNGTDALVGADGEARELLLRTALTPEGDIEISVSDTGAVLPPRLAAKLVEPFFSAQPDGKNLGLAVSRYIVETHGGRLWVSRNSEHGVTFRFTLPTEASA